MDEWARLAPYPTEWLDHSIVLSPKKNVIQIGPKSKSMKSNCNTQIRWMDRWMDGWINGSLIGDCAVVGGLTLKHASEGEREREPHKDVLVISFATKRVCGERGGGRAMALLQLCRVHIPVCNSTNSPVALLLDNNGANNSSQSAHLTAFSNSAACYHHGVDVRLFASSSSSSSNRRGAAAGSLLQVLFFLSPPQNCSA